MAIRPLATDKTHEPAPRGDRERPRMSPVKTAGFGVWKALRNGEKAKNGCFLRCDTGADIRRTSKSNLEPEKNSSHGRPRSHSADHRGLRVARPRREGGGTPVSPDNVVGLILAIGLTVFLVAALLRPEKF
ncbi:K(+)-transporting ATPase subunit F [Actinocorallia aurantiaca]|uniref:K+-transporting ATPase KdpF subunit n=1 Tax=Actinocorallia aurantiaca TaxID=46204 RepID=A0ABN3UNW6_9ACTN